MRSKIIVDLMDGEVPCLRVEREFDGGGDLPDKVLRSMFQRLIDSRGIASSFLGTVKPRDTDSTFIVPLTLGHALELMHRAVIENYGRDSNIEERLHEAFGVIFDVVSRKPVSS